jgi:hypothetical protein
LTPLNASSSFSLFLMLFFRLGFSFLLMDPFWHLVGLLGRGINPAPRPLPTQDNTNTEKRRHTSMPRAGFEPVIPMFERPKTVLALDCAATETDSPLNACNKITSGIPYPHFEMTISHLKKGDETHPKTMWTPVSNTATVSQTTGNIIQKIRMITTNRLLEATEKSLGLKHPAVAPKYHFKKSLRGPFEYYEKSRNVGYGY